MRIALDFDGVLHDHVHPVEGRRMGAPIEGALEGVNELLRQGHLVCIHTVRAAKSEHIYDWLEWYGFPELTVCTFKPDADLYVDDKGLRFYDWPTALEDVDMVDNLYVDNLYV